MCVCACCLHTREAATNFNFVSSLKATQVILIIPQTSSSSAMEINIYRMAGEKKEKDVQKGRRGKQEQRKRKPKTLVVTMTTASHLAEDRKGWK